MFLVIIESFKALMVFAACIVIVLGSAAIVGWWEKRKGTNANN